MADQDLTTRFEAEELLIQLDTYVNNMEHNPECIPFPVVPGGPNVARLAYSSGIASGHSQPLSMRLWTPLGRFERPT